MGQTRHAPGDLQQLRTLAVGSSEFQAQSLRELEMAAVRGDTAAAQEVLHHATLRTNVFRDLHGKLGGAGVMLSRYGVKVLNDHTIVFVLPKDCSRVAILQEACDVVMARDGIHLIGEWQLSLWAEDDRFTGAVSDSQRVCIDGHVKALARKNRPDQEGLLREKRLALPNKEDLAVAFVLHWVATREPLFQWYMDEKGGCTYRVRDATSGLVYNLFDPGLTDDNLCHSNDDYNVAGSALVSPDFDARAKRVSRGV